MDPHGGGRRGGQGGGRRGHGGGRQARGGGRQAHGGGGQARGGGRQQAQQANAPDHPEHLHGDIFNVSTDWDVWNHPHAWAVDWVPPAHMCPAHVWEGLNGYRRYIIFMRETLCAGQPVVTLDDPESPQDPARFRTLPLVGNNYRTFDLRLRDDDRTITVRICWENIYLLGYRNGHGEWFCFEDYAHFFVGENLTILHYKGNYRAIGEFTKRSGTTINFGKVPFGNAIQTLSRLRPAQRHRYQMARGIEVIMTMICEATRFEALSCTFETLSIPFRVAQLDGLATIWSRLSVQVLAVNNNLLDEFHILPSAIKGEQESNRNKTIKGEQRVLPK